MTHVGILDDRYFITEEGCVLSTVRGGLRELKPGLRGKKSNPYYHVVLSDGVCAKSYSVHRLVAAAFIPNPNNLPQVNHIDKNTLNNHKDNLEWLSNRDNVRYSQAKRYYFIDPSGSHIAIDDLPSFCDEKGLCRPHMVAVHNSKRPSHKGFTKGESQRNEYSTKSY